MITCVDGVVVTGTGVACSILVALMLSVESYFVRADTKTGDESEINASSHVNHVLGMIGQRRAVNLVRGRTFKLTDNLAIPSNLVDDI